MDNVTLQHKMKELKAQFPALNQTVYGRPLVYLDNAATTQKPQRVMQMFVDATGGATGCLPVELVPRSAWGDIHFPKWAQR